MRSEPTSDFAVRNLSLNSTPFRDRPEQRPPRRSAVVVRDGGARPPAERLLPKSTDFLRQGEWHRPGHHERRRGHRVVPALGGPVLRERSGRGNELEIAGRVTAVAFRGRNE
jgi:hypothetical protein